MAISSPGTRPAASMASTSICTASSLEARSGANPPSSPDRGGQAPALQHPGQGVVGLDPPAQGLGERGRPDRHDHELLEVDRVVGVDAAVDHVHHRHRQHVGVRPRRRSGRGAARARRPRPWPWPATRRGWRWPRAGPCWAVPSASIRARSTAALVERVQPVEDLGDLAVDVGRPPRATPLPPVAVAAVAQLDGLERAGGGARRDDGPPGGPRVEDHLDLDGRVAARVEDLTADDLFDDAHGGSSLLSPV